MNGRTAKALRRRHKSPGTGHRDFRQTIEGVVCVDVGRRAYLAAKRERPTKPVAPSPRPRRSTEEKRVAALRRRAEANAERRRIIADRPELAEPWRPIENLRRAAR